MLGAVELDMLALGWAGQVWYQAGLREHLDPNP